MKKILSLFMSLILLTHSFVSCSPDTRANYEIEKNSNLEISNKVDFILNSYLTIQNEIATSRNLIPDPLDQETIDYYADLLGLTPGSVSLEDVNEIITNYALATDQGIETVLNQYNLSNLTKLTLADISEGNVIENLNDLVGYNQLPLNEREIIEAANLFVSEAQNRDIGCSVGAFIGFVVGSFVCTPVCQIVGVIIGCSVGKN